MDSEGFIELVRRMRRAQLDYYADKYKVYGKLVAAKNLERQVDAALRAGVEIKPTAAPEPTAIQTSLFMENDDDKTNN